MLQDAQSGSAMFGSAVRDRVGACSLKAQGGPDRLGYVHLQGRRGGDIGLQSSFAFVVPMATQARDQVAI